jgi:prepilin-type N-terminal cleavage/methylation domain-containing protein
VRRVLRGLRRQAAYTLVEMLTVMIIMGVILTGMTSLFVQGSNSQLDMNRRFEAQQAARVVLDKMRREIHCAQGATTASSPLSAQVTLDLPGQCALAVNHAQTYVSWCTQPVAAGRYALYRKAGSTCDATGVKWADDLTDGSIFQYQAHGAESKARLYVNLRIDVDPTDATTAYALCDHITLRNTLRTGLAGPALPSC